MTLVIGRTTDLDACLALRRTIFIEEQQVPEAEERDRYDAIAYHLLARLDGKPIGTARILQCDDTVKIGRVCVLPDHRGAGVGVALLGKCHAIAREIGASRAVLGAQLSALGFYERLGYMAYGDVFEDAGIAHRMMALAL